MIGWVKEVSDWYDEQPLRSDLRSHNRLSREVSMLTGALPVSLYFGEDSQPYRTLAALTAAIQKGHLVVFSGGEKHPGWSAETNRKFRACHDFYGHYIGQHVFSTLEGELMAFSSQARFHTVEALPALATEVVGQICWFYQHDKTFAPQKAVAMPGELWRHLLPTPRRITDLRLVSSERKEKEDR